jgi:Tol biopolymer transport system component/tRNA A-37 threonylcarbamoyl transferase component Bud32
MIGRTLSHYEITEKLGEGGMGVVYKARDTHLNRPVAIKVLPQEKVADAERTRRFVQEAKAASALNHPNIVTIYDVDQVGEVNFIAMEFVEGKPLSELIPQNGMSLNDTLKYSIQIADALARAHERGIVHRDLKPGNVMVSTRGLVKILDFGLAKLTEAVTADDSEATRTSAAPKTEVGTVVGTAAYMSPEQARGHKVDARSDIFSFGAVLYELVTGRRAFPGDSPMGTIAAVINQEPIPARQFAGERSLQIEGIIERCLRKDPERRWQDFTNLRVALEDLKPGSDSGRLETKSPPAPPTAKRRRLLLPVAAALALVLVGAAVWIPRLLDPSEGRPEQPLYALPFTTMEGSERTPTFSPDGNQVAFSWNGESGENFDIYAQVVGSGSPLRLTKDPAQDTAPAWSPDGRYVAFIRSTGVNGEGAIYLVSPLGGAERKVAEGIFLKHHENWPTRLGWAPDGKTLFLSELDGGAQGIFSVDLATGEKRRLTSPPTHGDYSLAVSPDGETVAFARLASAGLASSLYVAPIRGGEPRRLAVPLGSVTVTWMPDGKEIVYAAGQAAGFSPSLWRIAVAGGEPRRLPILGDGGVMPVVSPSGRRLIYVRLERDANLWRYDRPERDGDSWQTRKLTTSTHLDSSPRISPDGRRIAFASTRSGNTQIWVAESDGANQVQLTSLKDQSGSPRWSPDGRSIVFDARTKGDTDIYVVDSHGGPPRPIVVEAGNQDRPSWSHDAMWIYFASDHTGTKQIWKIRAGGGNLIQITRRSGEIPFESADGRFVYFVRPGERTVWRVPAEGGEEVAVVTGLSTPDRWDVVADGIYFVAEERDAASRSSWVLKLFRFDTQKVSVVTKLDRPTFGATPLDVSPDGKWFVWVQADRNDSDLMLVENFR